MTSLLKGQMFEPPAHSLLRKHQGDYQLLIQYFCKNILTLNADTEKATDNHPGVCEGENELEVQTFDL